LPPRFRAVQFGTRFLHNFLHLSPGSGARGFNFAFCDNPAFNQPSIDRAKSGPPARQSTCERASD
jgi:hypothetical protein